eukprot:3951221-Pyramimonas_sp.AAC.1
MSAVEYSRGPARASTPAALPKIFPTPSDSSRKGWGGPSRRAPLSSQTKPDTGPVTDWPFNFPMG